MCPLNVECRNIDCGVLFQGAVCVIWDIMVGIVFERAFGCLYFGGLIVLERSFYLPFKRRVSSRGHSVQIFELSDAL